jgi:protocatechuate 3,4-dioxygenase beta subunit
MFRKIIPRIFETISILGLAACTATRPAATPSNNSSTSGTSELACSAGSQSAALTVEVTEGPYFTAGSPQRPSLVEDGMTGTKIVISGYVYTTECKPVANAWLDFWQADANGVYDNSGYTLRGHQFTDSNGRYQLMTVVPGLYPGRTEHIHVKVQAPNGKLITSQLFFPGVAQNDSDGIYNPRLLLAINKSSDGLQGQFNFVVPVS